MNPTCCTITPTRWHVLEESQGFEPWCDTRSHSIFGTDAFNHSANSPNAFGVNRRTRTDISSVTARGFTLKRCSPLCLVLPQRFERRSWKSKFHVLPVRRRESDLVCAARFERATSCARGRGSDQVELHTDETPALPRAVLADSHSL